MTKLPLRMTNADEGVDEAKVLRAVLAKRSFQISKTAIDAVSSAQSQVLSSGR